MKILITGGAGFIGTHLRTQLVNEGHSVRIFDNLLPQVHGEVPAIDFGDCDFILGDVRDAESMSKAVKGIDIVYHLAAETGVGQSQYEIGRYISTNTLGTAVVLDASAQAGVKQVIITSSRAVYGEGLHICSRCSHRFVPTSRRFENLDEGNWEVLCPLCGQIALFQPMKEGDPVQPISVYGLTKVQQEQIAEQVSRVHNIKVTNLRLFNVFGPGQSLSNPYVGVLGTFFRRIKSGDDIDLYEDGQMRRDFVYVGDVVNALQLTKDTEHAFNKTINVGTGNGPTLEEAGREMFRLLGVEPKIRFSGKYRLGDIHHAVADTELIERALNYRPGTTFPEGLKSFVSWALEETFCGNEIDTAAESQLWERNLLRQAQK
jgi:Nucleoside-diphosphate-sugar epimerases